METLARWTVGREYKQGAAVLFEEAAYRCVADTSAGESPRTAPHKWLGTDSAQSRATRALGEGGFDARA